MNFSRGARAGVLAFSLLAAGCHIHRPGEVRPEPIAACAPDRVAALESRFTQATPAEREFLNYCRNAQAATSLRATQEHVDYLADLQFIGILLGVVSTLVNLIIIAT